MSLDTGARARVNLGAVARNCERLRAALGDAQLCAVVKANGYGHGAQACALAALEGGASRLAVASVGEARELDDVLADQRPRVPVLVLGPIADGDLQEAVSCRREIVIWDERLVPWLQEIGHDSERPAKVHVKLDTGMGRLGTRDPAQADRIVQAVLAAAPDVELVGLMTHFATADELGDDFFAGQLRRFTEWTRPIKRAHPEVIVHAANSAAVLRDPAAHFDMARCGIAIYGLDPFGVDPSAHDLEPALELGAHIADVKLCRAGESTGYGRRFVAAGDTHLGLLPIGYGDGWRRALSGDAEALIAGRRHPLVGTVSMDSVAVDLGPDPGAPALRGEPAVLIGAQGEQRILAEDIARRMRTINYEVTCGLGARLQRDFHRDGDRSVVPELDY